MNNKPFHKLYDQYKNSNPLMARNILISKEYQEEVIMAALDEIRKKIKEKKCRWCGEDLDVNNIEMYPHSDGWTVQGKKEKQWLYITCNSDKCHGYQWALWKLGVPRE